MTSHDSASAEQNACCNCLSRRRFLQVSSAGAVGLTLADQVGHAGEPEDRIAAATLRPDPHVRVAVAVLRVKPPYWLGWPGTSYDVEGWREKYLQETRRTAAEQHLRLEVADAPLEDDAAVNAFVENLKADAPDGVLVILQHLGVWSWAERIAAAGVPTIVFSPIGTSFTGHIARFSWQQGVYVLSGLDFSAVEQALRMVRAKRMFEESRVLVVSGNQRAESVLECLGIKVRTIPRRVFQEWFERQPVTPEVREVVARVKKAAAKVVEPTDRDFLNAARAYVTAKRLMKAEQANALSMDCLGMVSARVMPTPPCLAWSLLQDQGVTGGCEADLFAAVSLMFSSYVFDKPGFINDPVADTARNELVAAHCVCGTRLNGFDKPAEPFILRTHSESDVGVSIQTLWRAGQPVTLVRFQNPTQLILDTGTVTGNVDTPPAGGCRTSVRIRMDRVDDARDVLGFHQVVFYGNHRREVEAFCQLYGLKVVHSPERHVA